MMPTMTRRSLVILALAVVIGIVAISSIRSNINKEAKFPEKSKQKRHLGSTDYTFDIAEEHLSEYDKGRLEVVMTDITGPKEILKQKQPSVLMSAQSKRHLTGKTDMSVDPLEDKTVDYGNVISVVKTNAQKAIDYAIELERRTMVNKHPTNVLPVFKGEQSGEFKKYVELVKHSYKPMLPIITAQQANDTSFDPAEFEDDREAGLALFEDAYSDDVGAEPLKKAYQDDSKTVTEKTASFVEVEDSWVTATPVDTFEKTASPPPGDNSNARDDSPALFMLVGNGSSTEDFPFDTSYFNNTESLSTVQRCGFLLFVPVLLR